MYDKLCNHIRSWLDGVEIKPIISLFSGHMASPAGKYSHLEGYLILV